MHQLQIVHFDLQIELVLFYFRWCFLFCVFVICRGVDVHALKFNRFLTMKISYRLHFKVIEIWARAHCMRQQSHTIASHFFLSLVPLFSLWKPLVDHFNVLGWAAATICRFIGQSSHSAVPIWNVNWLWWKKLSIFLFLRPHQSTLAFITSLNCVRFNEIAMRAPNEKGLARNNTKQRNEEKARRDIKHIEHNFNGRQMKRQRAKSEKRRAMWMWKPYAFIVAASCCCYLFLFVFLCIHIFCWFCCSLSVEVIIIIVNY